MVSLADDGSFLAKWAQGTYDSDNGVYGRHFSSSDQPDGGVLRLHADVDSLFYRLGGDGRGNHVVVYRRSGRLVGRLLPRDARAGTVSFGAHLDRTTDVATIELPTTVRVAVIRTGGHLGDLSANVVVAGGSARPGEDFAGTVVPVTFREGGETSRFRSRSSTTSGWKGRRTWCCASSRRRRKCDSSSPPSPG